jgi:trimeric autotransporter adhesin
VPIGIRPPTGVVAYQPQQPILPSLPVRRLVRLCRPMLKARNATVTVNAGGALNLYGDYVNNGTLSATSGTVAFRGAASQSVDAVSAADVIVDGAGVVLDGNMEANNSLTLISGNISLGIYNIRLNKSASGNVASHIITGSTGSVIINNVTPAVTIPVGATAGGYNPVTIANGQNLTYTVRVAEGLIGAVVDNSKAINRTWTVTTTTIPASPVEITLQYADAEANANCNPAAAMDAGAYNGITYAVVSPSAGIMPTGSATVRLAKVTTTQLGSLVLVNQGAVKVTVDAFSVKLMPTVVTGNSTLLRVQTPRTMNIEWTVTDMSGKLIMQFKRKLTPGVNDINISLPGVANGVYHLRGVSDDGKTPVIKFLVQH